jgi:Kyakuja-Dileera-Zisupton transposase
MRSSLGNKARDCGLQMVVPGFHGHAHNRLCQLSNHIMMSEGFGLEDLETCERVFSGSNAVARLTHHASGYHHRQFIDLFFHQWDAEKYENLGKLSSDVQIPEVLMCMSRHFFIQQLPAGFGDSRRSTTAHPNAHVRASSGRDTVCRVARTGTGVSPFKTKRTRHRCVGCRVRRAA